MTNRDLSTPIKQVFGDVEKGTECRICGRNVTDGRSKYCSDYCSNLSSAVMMMLNWNSVRRQIINRDDEICQHCGFDYSRERKARRHIKQLIEDTLPEKPTGPALSEVNTADFDWDAYNDKREEWNEKKEELEEKYGDPYENTRELEVDHITRIADGGHPYDPANLQTLCDVCHSSKTADENQDQNRSPSASDINKSLFDYVETEAKEGKPQSRPDAATTSPLEEVDVKND